MTPLNQGSPTPLDDIPEALRDPLSTPPRAGVSLPRWRSLLGISSLIGLGLGVMWLVIALQSAPSTTVVDPVDPIVFEAESGPGAIASIRQVFFPMGGSVVPISPDQPSLLGHRYYPEAPLQSLVSLNADGSIKLRSAAAAKVRAMLAQSRAEGVALQVVSGFRSEADQRYLFFEMSAHRGQSPTQRAEVSAPPGYSEHHTGYAVDFTDGYYPDTDLEVGFERTPAFQWLQANAARYGFELSFPQDNSQGVSYEPWHWRFVGDRDSLETFYQNP